MHGIRDIDSFVICDIPSPEPNYQALIHIQYIKS